MNQQLENNPDRYVLALLDNLFFAAKIIEAARQANLSVTTKKKAESAYRRINESPPLAIILDLDAAECQPLSLIKLLREAENLSRIPTIGFVAHVNTNTQSEARAAGVQRVLARSVFSRELPQILNEFANSESA